MLFKQMCLINYGTFDGKHRVYKVFFVTDEEPTLFLQGYFIYYPNGTKKFIANREINDLYDYKTLDDADVFENILFTEDGKKQIVLSNNSVEGLPKVINAFIEFSFFDDKFISEENEIDIDELLKELKQEDESVYLLLKLKTIAKKMELTLNDTYTVDIETVLNEVLTSLSLTSFQFREFICDKNEKLLSLFDYTFINRGLLELNIKNLVKFLKLKKAIKDKIENIKTFEDFAFIVKEFDVLPISSITMLPDNINSEKEKEIIIELSKDPDELNTEIENALLSMLRINNIQIYINGVLKIDMDIYPVYQNDIVKIKNTTKSYGFNEAVLEDNVYKISKNKVFLSLNNGKFPFFEAKKDDIYVTIKKKVDDDFNVVLDDNNVYKIKFNNKV